ncbi:MAG: type I-B CRISPR-associated endonuclease Cas1 [Epsilonproteobacteria bacterium]|nr:subtype I-B CRISPR-associated endonuclease Cas1 [Campylobacterota bacterium]NPA56157.1 type I-B CRISPR-associated endonuclease Cas1 [Campylobacterota bacterium]
MGKRSIYIFRNGELKRKDNTLLLQTGEGKRIIPIHTVDQIHVFGELHLNRRVLELLTSYGIVLHFYNYYGYYDGTYYPRSALNSGFMVLQQARCYLDESERLYLARRFVEGALRNMERNIAYYHNRAYDLGEVRKKIREALEELEGVEGVEELMGVEGNVRKIYYQAFDTILGRRDFVFDTRTRRPPRNALNALISFGNSLLYTTALSQIYRTYLDPRIGYLHETNRRSFSLNLDVAEVFKPIIVDRVVFSLVKKQIISIRDFEQAIDCVYLNERGQKTFIKVFEEKLATTINYKNIGKVSYRKLIRLECYKLYKHFLLEELYKPFVARW